MYHYLSTLPLYTVLIGIVILTCLLYGFLVLLTGGVREEIENDWIYGTRNNYKFNADEDDK